jgi:hypothetical protein
MIEIGNTGCLQCNLPGKDIDEEGLSTERNISCCWHEDGFSKKIGPGLEQTGWNWKCGGGGVIGKGIRTRYGQFPRPSAGINMFKSAKLSNNDVCKSLGANAFREDPAFFDGENNVSLLTGDPNEFTFGCSMEACKSTCEEKAPAPAPEPKVITKIKTVIKEKECPPSVPGAPGITSGAIMARLDAAKQGVIKHNETAEKKLKYGDLTTCKNVVNKFASFIDK